MASTSQPACHNNSLKSSIQSGAFEDKEQTEDLTLTPRYNSEMRDIRAIPEAPTRSMLEPNGVSPQMAYAGPSVFRGPPMQHRPPPFGYPSPRSPAYFHAAPTPAHYRMPHTFQHRGSHTRPFGRPHPQAPALPSPRTRFPGNPNQFGGRNPAVFRGFQQPFGNQVMYSVSRPEDDPKDTPGDCNESRQTGQPDIQQLSLTPQKSYPPGPESSRSRQGSLGNMKAKRGRDKAPGPILASYSYPGPCSSQDISAPEGNKRRKVVQRRTSKPGKDTIGQPNEMKEPTPQPQRRKENEIQRSMTPTLARTTCAEKEGKKLILTVSASPTDQISKGRSVQLVSRTSGRDQLLPPALPDSPGSGLRCKFSAKMGQEAMTEENRCNGHVREDSFSLLPNLDHEGDIHTRSSPPMMPDLAVVPQLSWDINDEELGDEQQAKQKDNGKMHFNSSYAV
jgi:hypothetical protein